MIHINERKCPKCGGKLHYYDHTKRIVQSKRGVIKYINVRRFKCGECSSFHREMPNVIFPYKHYEVDIITGVIEGLITSDTLGFEDYPCEMTIKRWKREFDNK